jgi:hypothetical protein
MKTEKSGQLDLFPRDSPPSNQEPDCDSVEETGSHDHPSDSEEQNARLTQEREMYIARLAREREEREEDRIERYGLYRRDPRSSFNSNL